MDAQQFGQIRERAGLTQVSLAALLRSDVRTVRRWEAGEREVSGPASLLMEMVAAGKLGLGA